MSPSITCPQCMMVSHHPKDIEEKYCGNCHQFHADMKIRVKIRPYNPFNLWVVLNANDLGLGWSGSQWVPLFGDVQVSNFLTEGDAAAYARIFGFKIVDDRQQDRNKWMDRENRLNKQIKKQEEDK
jgi:hypothetical protein